MPATIQDLERIVRKGDKFFLRHTWNELESVKVAHPAYTGNTGMNGRQGISKVTKIVSEGDRVVERVETVEVTEEEAKVCVDWARITGLITRTERVSRSRRIWQVFVG